MEKLAERIGDADKEVREALLALLGDGVLPALGPAALAPFLPLLMAHISAAMTHLNDTIRWGAGVHAMVLAVKITGLLYVAFRHPHGDSLQCRLRESSVYFMYPAWASCASSGLSDFVQWQAINHGLRLVQG